MGTVLEVENLDPFFWVVKATHGAFTVKDIQQVGSTFIIDDL
jgi:uncharacterized protein YqgV (UPF0045/DUF77 family)